jgi:hypothetical protein
LRSDERKNIEGKWDYFVNPLIDAKSCSVCLELDRAMLIHIGAESRSGRGRRKARWENTQNSD